MVIMHNLSAMNGNRMYGINNKKKTSVTEKLSSGYRINRAADDAAGLAISEKMRRQIRGLSQGADNIKDGMSLVQVADGALDEVTSCLQRINELSIQAYNGTNQKEDKEYIQSEIEQLITEVQRIADTTTFNKIPVLKGNPKILTKIEHDKIVDGYTYKEYEATIPDWLSVTPEFSTENSKNVTIDNLDTTSNAVLQVSPGVYEYYGSPSAELDKIATYGGASGNGAWSTDMNQKASAIIDFSGLTNAETASDLFSDLFELIGTSIGVPCGTCTEYYGISFTGSELGLEIKDGTTKFSNGSAESVSYLNLSDWKPWSPDEELTIFDKVRNLIKNQLNETDPDKIKNSTQTLAQDIAGKLCEETVSRITMTVNGKENTHFNRASKITGNNYALMIYDFRDVNKLANEESADSLVQISSCSYAKVPVSMLQEGEIVEIQQSLWIQCSSNVKDKLPIDLPLLNNVSLGIETYNISIYEEKTTYSEQYLKAVEEWKKNDCYYEYTITVIPEQPEREEERYVTKIDFDRNGEPKPKTVKETVKVPATPEREIKTRIMRERSPKPQPGPGDVYIETTYSPSDVKDIADALTYVSMCRSDLGAAQNRLEHAYFNNLNVNENTTYAESKIRDADMAKEMVEFSNLNILEQVGHSLMAQANQNNQGVLSLLQ